MKALVTGATGFIGSNLVDQLIKERYDIKVLVRPSSSDKISASKNIKVIIGDLSDLTKIKNDIKDVDIVFNAAGALPHHHLSEKQYWETNVNGVKNLLEVYKGSGIKRFIHISTTGIYRSTVMANENSALHLDTVYTKSKAAGEKLVLKYFNDYDLPVTIIRPTIAYGPGDKRPGFFNLFPLIKKRLFIPVGKGNNFFHTVYIGNLIEALLLAAIKKEAIGEDFIIGDDPCPRMKQIIETIARVEEVKVWQLYLPIPLALLVGKFFDITKEIGVPPILNSQRVKFITEEKRYNINKAKKVLKYKSLVNLEEGIRKTYSWYMKNNFI